MEINNVKLNIDQKSNSETTKPVSQDTTDDSQVGGVNGKNVEAAAAVPPNMKSSAPSDASQPHEVVILFVLFLSFFFSFYLVTEISFHTNRTLLKIQQGDLALEQQTQKPKTSKPT